MFTIEQINDVHEKLGTMKNFLNYVTALKLLGVEKYDSYLTDGHSQYFGSNGYHIESAPVHEKLPVADNSDKESFLRHLSLHGEGKTNYITMSRGLAESGIEKWTIDTCNATISYYDKQGNQLLVESIV
ncbi:uncharacterized protein YbcV (DUF1398 family) [Chitinophaga niastensis]|uniref:Uncharacterized protein YbcV (DUF1398 family) n=1 Tax=Chitinophaga niastensis TaxID=536980 RepID=A0A2P8HH59_CHINA|nr:DUF1398 family protein [Chitinophaga niastensis]PSL45564.1 uncharacterized protein YbcV (DUF1398 family) [Chitinophaga niastensis]